MMAYNWYISDVCYATAYLGVNNTKSKRSQSSPDAQPQLFFGMAPNRRSYFHLTNCSNELKKGIIHVNNYYYAT